MRHIKGLVEEACPSEEEHRQLLGESLPPERHAQIILHLEHCQNCQATCEAIVRELDRNDQTTALDGLQNTQQVNRIVELVRLQVPDQESQQESIDRCTTLPIESADLEKIQLEYQLIKELGRGGQGLVYLARDISLERNVVIKLLSPVTPVSQVAVERFKREARSVASLNSRYIVPIYRVGSLPSGRHFMVMEYVAGNTLRQLHQSGKKFSYQATASIIHQIAMGLSDAHAQRVVHRDIKPENILIQSSDSVARIVDFGLAFDIDDEARITVDGTIAGTPAYMSPEQVADPHSVDSSTDIYSLGVVLYELLTGEVPFRGTARMTMMQMLHEDAVAPSLYDEHAPKDLETICLRAMCKDRSKRFRSARELADELERHLKGQPIESRPISRLDKLWRQVKKNPIVATLVGSVVVLVSVLAILLSFYAVHLNSLNQRIARQASISNQQRDAALATLGDLTVQLQRKFDDPTLFIEEIQQSTLEIALRGLEKMDGLAGQSLEGGLARAIALRRLGETLSQLEKYEDAEVCIEKSELILRELSLKESQNVEVIVAFADAILASEEFEVDRGEEEWLAKLQKAIDNCRRLNVKDVSVSTKLCELLNSRAESEIRLGLLKRAEESLTAGMHQVSPYWNQTDLPSEMDLRDAILSNRLRSIDLQRIARTDHQQAADRLLEQVMAFPESEQLDGMVLEAKLALFESLGLLKENASESYTGKWGDSLSSLLEEMRRWAAADSQEYTLVSATLAGVAMDRLEIGIERTARDFLRLRASLAKERLEHLASDRFALLEMFDSHAALADIEFSSGSRKRNQRTFDYCTLAMQGFERLVAISSVGEDEWSSLADVIEMFLDVCEEDIAQGGQMGSQLKLRSTEMERWVLDDNVTATARADDLEKCKSLLKQMAAIAEPSS